MPRWLSCSIQLAALLMPASLGAEGSPPRQLLNAPVLGYVLDASRGSVRPIWGIPGASTLGQPFQLGVALRRVEVSARQDYALAVTAAGEVVAIGFAASGDTGVRQVAGAAPGADRIALSPMGRAAALYSRAGNAVQIVTGLPAAPSVTRTVDLSTLPGALAAAAVNDEGALLAAFSERGLALLFLVKPDESVQFVTPLGEPAALSFLPNGRDALVADGRENTVYLIRDLAGAAAATLVAGEADAISRPVAVETSLEGDRAFVAGSSGTILAVDLATGDRTALTCRCTPTGLARLNGRAVFRLTEPSADPLWVLDADAPEPALVFVPADAAPAAVARGAEQ